MSKHIVWILGRNCVHCHKLSHPPILCLSHTHSEHWVISVVYFLLWVAVQSLRNIVLRLYFSICGHQTSITGFNSELVRNVDSEPPQTRWIRTCLLAQSPWDSCTLESMRTSTVNQPPVLFQYLPCFYGYFFLAGSHLSKLTYVLAPSRLFIFSEVER